MLNPAGRVIRCHAFDAASVSIQSRSGGGEVIRAAASERQEEDPVQ